MRLMINASNLLVGGGVQVAHSFLEELKDFGQDEYFVLLSSPLRSQLDISSYPERFTFYHIPVSPARVMGRQKVTRELGTLEKRFRPDVVFSVFGPSYYRPSTVHVMGFAYGWAIYPDSSAYRILSKAEAWRSCVRRAYVKYYTKRDGDYFIVETETVKERLVRYRWTDASRIFVVGNTFHRVFETQPSPSKKIRDDGKFRFVTISAAYPHKNLQIIREVVPLLKAKRIECRFYVTLPDDAYKKYFSGVEEWVYNLGPLCISECPGVYMQCDAVCLPTLLECFSASYPEAMKMGLPIVTSDRDFAHSICGDAAEYVDPLNPVDIAEKIEILVKNRQRRDELRKRGYARLQMFPSARTRAEKYVAICKSVTERHGTVSV